MKRFISYEPFRNKKKTFVVFKKFVKKMKTAKNKRLTLRVSSCYKGLMSISRVIYSLAVTHRAR